MCFLSNHANDFKRYVSIITSLTEKISVNLQMMDRFTQMLKEIFTKQEAKYFLEMLIESNFIKPEKVSNIRTTLYFSHYWTEANVKNSDKKIPFYDHFFKSFDALKKNNWELQKKLVHDGVNPSEIAIAIREDNVEKLQEISAQTNFDFNQKIVPSLYERCTIVNENNVSLINYAAFFCSIKCFKFLLLNDCNTTNTTKFAVAGGNFEIFQLCEQYHLSFENTLEIAIEYHRNQIIKYLYENQIVKNNDLTQLGLLCVIHKNFEILAFLESYGMCINDKMVNTAAEDGNFYLVKHFVEGNTLPNNIFPYAAASRNIELVRYVLTFEGVNLNAFNEWGYPALIRALRKYNKDVFALLLDQYTIDINIKDKDGFTPLICAAANGLVDAVKLLLANENVDINAVNNFGNSALLIACVNGQSEVVKLLLNESKINTKVKNSQGKNAIFIAAESGWYEVLEVLVQHGGFDLNCYDNEGYYPLYHPAKKGFINTTKILVSQKGIKINAKDKKLGNTPLMIAADNGYLEVVKILLEQKGIDINARNHIYMTALMYATHKGYTNIVKILLECKGFDINAKDMTDTSLTIAAGKGYIDIVKLLLDQKGINIKKRNICDNTAFLAAIQSKHIEIVKLFLEKFDININETGDHNQTALIMATTTTYEMVDLILKQKGVKINVKDKEGKTALHVALEYNHIKIANLLLQQEGIEVNIKNDDGFTPLMVAANFGEIEIIEPLLDKGADKYIKNKKGETAIDIAYNRGHNDVAELIKNH